MHIQTVSKYIRRSPYQSIAAILIMSLTFFTIGVFSLITIVSIRAIDHLESQPQLSIFFKEGSIQQDVEALRNELEDTGKVKSIKFISKEEAFAIYKNLNKEDPLLLDLVTSDILPASLDVQAIDAADLTPLAQIAKSSKSVEQINYQKDVIDNLVRITEGLRQIGMLIIGVLLAVSIFVILTIIGIKITVRKDEIEIMKLIGASNWFIRTPFLLEGMFYGAVGAIVGWGITYGVLYFNSSTISYFFGSIQVLPISPILMFQVLGVLFVSAIILGAFSSFLAVLRYLK